MHKNASMVQTFTLHVELNVETKLSVVLFDKVPCANWCRVLRTPVTIKAFLPQCLSDEAVQMLHNSSKRTAYGSAAAVH